MIDNESYIGKLLDNRYEIQDIIGEGGMAVMYKAYCHRLNRFVAVKIMRSELAEDEEFRRHFLAESYAIAMLSHPNIVAVYDVSSNDDVRYIVMELIEGITLKQYLDKQVTINWKEVVHFSKQIAKALAHAHERGIIHRDIKPQNIMLLRDGTIKVADFGIAALEGERQENGVAVGSIHYIAPEQAHGLDSDARSDIYSLGIVMYEMLTGRKPYEGDSIAQIAVKHLSSAPRSITSLVPDVPVELERIVEKSMSIDIDERYQTADELYDALESFVQSQLHPLEEEPIFENPAVVPVRSLSEMSKEKFNLRRKRSGVVAFMSGTLGAMLVVIGLFSFLWNFWLKDVFSPAERIPLPNFIGSNYENISNNVELEETYNFNVTYVIDTANESGRILSQNPEAGRSMMLTPEGINVDITVSTGVVLTPVPDVQNMDYREASLELQKAGLKVELENATSASVAKDMVISTSPAANEQISAGSTVYVIVSSGAEVSYITMPNLVGLTEDAAIIKLENAGLSFGGSEMQISEFEAGTVIGQNVTAFTDIEEHTRVFLKISSGSWG